MIAQLRKNLACLITKHSLSVRKSDASYTLPLHFFSTWKGSRRQVATTLEVYDMLVLKHQISSQVASLAASRVTQLRSPENADLILSFLEDCGFSSTQLEKIVKYEPRILTRTVEDIKLKIKILQDLGLSSEDFTKIITHHQVILHLSAKSNIIPTLSLLKGLLGSDNDVARLLRKSGWFISSDLESTLLPNVELLKSRGIPMERILYLVYSYPRCLLLKPDTIRKSVDKAKEIGLSENSNLFVHAIQVFASLQQGMWEVKLQAFRDLGFSDSDTLTMVKKAPRVFATSMNKIEKIKELLLAKGKYNLSSIVTCPASLFCSIENRYLPRLRVLAVLESRNLIKEWPCLSRISTLSDDKFFERYIRPYSYEVGEALTQSYVNGKGKER